MRNAILVIMWLSILLWSAYALSNTGKTLADRVATLELQVKNLEVWAQRQGMRYKGGQR
jgi:hypothetical protein